jgi:hypothetical protein
MNSSTRTRLIHGALVFFAAGAVLGAFFVIVGPVALIRLFGVVALVLSALGCALELYALRHFAPRAYVALGRRLAPGQGRTRTEPALRPLLARSVVLSRR